MTATEYPLRLNIDYPEEPNRLTAFFRLIVSIPIIIVATLAGMFQNSGLQIAAPLVMILSRGKYPRWWFDWNLAMMRFSTRLWAYVFLITHEYPSTDEEQSVHLDFEYPDVQRDLNRWLPLVKWLLVIPHVLVLLVLLVAAVLSAIVVWFAILFTGRVPRGLFNFMVGVFRYGARIEVYAFVLTTDKYPPFRLSE